MTLKEKHGNMVTAVFWTVDGSQESSTCGADEKMYLSSEYYGDHAENWIVWETNNGDEIARYNTRFIDTIVWRK